MPDVTLVCPCGRTLLAPPRWSGRRVLCPACRTAQVVPAPLAASPHRSGGWGRRRRGAAALARGDAGDGVRARPAPPPGLVVARRLLHPGDVADRRRRRRRRLIVLGVLVVVVTAAWVGGRVAWQNYRRSLYRGHEPVPVRAMGEARDLQRRLRELRPLERAAEARPHDTVAAAAWVEATSALVADLGTASLYPHERAVLCNELAWYHLTTPLTAFRDPQAALELARAALFGAHRHDPAHLDTFAEALFQNGRLTAALEAAGEAVLRAPDSAELRETYERIEDALLR